MAKIAVMGFVGAGNLGDEAILAGTLAELSRQGHDDVTVFSWHPDETAASHKVAKCAPILPGLAGLRDFYRRLGRRDLFLLGGGSLLQDGQRRVVPFWLMRAFTARLRGCRVVYHAQGVGPLRTFTARLLVRLLVPVSADMVTLRDTESFGHIPSIVKPRLVADPALLLPPISVPKVEGRVVVALRDVPGMDDSEMELAACLAHFARRNELSLLFVPFHYPDDRDICQRMAKLTGAEAVDEALGVQGIRELLASSQLVVAMRLHAAILAAGLEIPLVGLSYDPKVSSFFAQLGMSGAQCAWDQQFRYQRLLDILHREYHSRDRQLARLAEVIPELKERARFAVSLALTWLGEA